METNWINIKDGMPNQGEIVLCYFETVLQKYYQIRTIDTEQDTHWQRLEPPKHEAS